jgi:hypothetical protein
VSLVTARKLVADAGPVEVACATGEVAPVDRSGEVDREPGGGEAVRAACRFGVRSMRSLNLCARRVLLTPAATLRPPIAAA